MNKIRLDYIKKLAEGILVTYKYHKSKMHVHDSALEIIKEIEIIEKEQLNN